MATTGRAFLAIWNTIAAQLDRLDYDAWLTREHLRERADLPGFLRARRYCGADADSYFNWYELADAEVLDSATYLASVETPSALTTAMRPHLLTSARGCYEVLARSGDGIGGALATLRFVPAGRFDAVRAARLLATLQQDRRVIGAQLAALRPNAAAPGDSAAIPYVLLLEGARIDTLKAGLPALLEQIASEAQPAGSIDAAVFTLSCVVA
jgi:hypothetical protein